MNPPPWADLDSIPFTLAAPKTFPCTEADRGPPESPNPPAHEAFTRLLKRQPFDIKALWQEAKAFVDQGKRLWVWDDTTEDVPYAQRMERVTYPWSGKHRRGGKGIVLSTWLWTDGNTLLPCDFRVYDKPLSQTTKNEHFRAMLVEAKEWRSSSIVCSSRAFWRLEVYRWRTRMSGYETKTAILRDAIRSDLAQPTYELISTE